MKRSIAFVFLIYLVFTRPAIAQSTEEDEPEANPGRPTVSTRATLTPVGYLQFESGFTGAHNSPDFLSRYSFNEVLKLSVTRRLEFLASAEPVAHFTADDATANRVADVFLGAQGILFQGEGPKPTLGAMATWARSRFHSRARAERRGRRSRAARQRRRSGGRARPVHSRFRESHPLVPTAPRGKAQEAAVPGGGSIRVGG